MIAEESRDVVPQAARSAGLLLCGVLVALAGLVFFGGALGILLGRALGSVALGLVLSGLFLLGTGVAAAALAARALASAAFFPVTRRELERDLEILRRRVS
jgi:hypothetical protein